MRFAQVSDFLFGSGGAKRAAELLEKKRAPEEVVRELDPSRFDPATAVRAAREAGGGARDARAVDRVREASRTSGIGESLDRLVESRTVEARERVR